MIENQETCCKVSRNYKSISLEECKFMGLEVTIKAKKKQLPTKIEDGHLINMMLCVKGVTQKTVNFNRFNAKSQNKDRSESMKEYQKMENAKKSVLELINKLNPNDRFCLIPFGGSNKVAIPFTDTQSMNKDQVQQVIKNIKCEGRTDIVSVIKTAINTIQQEQYHQKTIEKQIEQSTKKSQSSSQINYSSTSNRLTRNINVDDLELFSQNQFSEQSNMSNQIINRKYCFILLSDGEDNIHQNQALQRIRECIKNQNLNYSINCFGYGIEHDGNLLSSIAQLTGGQYYYIKENESIYEYLDECKNFQGEVLFENIEIQIDTSQNQQNIVSDKKITTELVDLPSSFVEIIKNKFYKTNFQHILSNSENKIFFSIKVKQQGRETSYRSSSSSSSSNESLNSPQLQQGQDNQRNILDLDSVKNLVLGQIKVSFCQKDDDMNYLNAEAPISIDVNTQNEYNTDVLKEITYRVFSNILQDSVSKTFSGQGESAQNKLDQLLNQLNIYSQNQKIQEFQTNIQIIKFVQTCLNNENIIRSSVKKRQLKLIIQEIVFYFKYNSQKSLKISEKIKDILNKEQSVIFSNDFNQIMNAQTLTGSVN